MIAFDSSAGTYVSNPVTSQTQSFTNTAGDFLCVHILGDNAATTGITGVTYNGVSLTKLATLRVQSSRAIDVYYMVNPATGANDVVISRGSSGLIISQFASYSGVDQTTPIPHFTTFDDSVNDTTLDNADITTTIDNSWSIIAIRETTGRTLTGGAGLTVREGGSGDHLGDSGGAIVTAGAHSFEGTYSGICVGGGILFELAVAGAAPAGTNSGFFALM